MQTNFVDIENIISDKTFFAHIEGKGSTKGKELLVDHIKLCEKYYKDIIEYKNIDKIYLRSYREIFDEDKYFEFFILLLNSVISFHDLGKINPKFQNDKMKNYDVKGEDLGKGSQHSVFSSLIYVDYFLEKLKLEFKLKKNSNDYKQLIKIIYAMGYVISRHHSDMKNFVDYDGKSYISNFNNDSLDTNTYIEMLRNKSLFNTEFIRNQDNRMRNFYSTSFKFEANYYDEDNSVIFILTRLMYSVLVASDYYATTEYMEEKKTKFDRFSIDGFRNVYYKSELMNSIREKEKTNSYLIDQDMNDVRTEIFLEVEKVYEEEKNKSIFFLESPTGSGKSNIATNLSYKMLEQGREKIVYAYPFNTLVEQNRKTLEKMYVGTEYYKYISTVNSITRILEEDEEKSYITDFSKLVLDRQFMHAPFVITSNVYLFNILFSNRRVDLFALYQLANSVIVLDEIQAYKSKIWIEIIEQLELYSNLFNIKIIIMSATLPDLSIFLKSNDNIAKLVKDPGKLFNKHIFKSRVNINYDLLKYKDITLNDIKEHMKVNVVGHDKILVEFIYKKRAEEYYNYIKGEKSFLEYEILILTGTDNLYYRNRIIEKISKMDTKVILISTQVIEAGVDIDMDIGYKDISIFENEEQFLGRINRSCKKSSSTVYFFDLDNEKSIYRENAAEYSSLRNEHRQKNLIDKDFIDYYEIKLKTISEKKENAKGYDEYISNRDKLNFENISEHMKLIDDKRNKNRYFFAREIKTDRDIINGKEVWQRYKDILEDFEMDYSEKYIRIFDVKVEMNLFLYEINDDDIIYNEEVGDIRYVEDGEKYFEDGRFTNRIGQRLFL